MLGRSRQLSGNFSHISNNSRVPLHGLGVSLNIGCLSQKMEKVQTISIMAIKQADTVLVLLDLPAPTVVNLLNVLTPEEELDKADFLMVVAIALICFFNTLFSSEREPTCDLREEFSARTSSNAFSNSSTYCFLRERD